MARDRVDELGRMTRRTALAALGLGSLVSVGRAAEPRARRPAEIKIGIATYLSGPGSVFGVPGRQTAEYLIDEINAAGGIEGVKLRPIFVDEGPGVEHFVSEYRRLVQSEGVSVVLSAISSADCIACSPLADELQRPTLLWDCGTHRIFEDARYRFAFRPGGYATPEMLAALIYLLKTRGDFKTIAVINQDYAWGRDSWEIFRTGLETLRPGVRVVAELFPRFGATDFSTEVTRLLATRPDVIFSTSWGGDLDSLIRQSADRRLFDRSLFVLPLGESSLQRVGKTLPPGHIIGARGDHWFLHPKPQDPARLNSFVEGYRKRFDVYPIYSCFHMAQAISCMTAAYEKALKARPGDWPTDTELADAIRQLEFPSPTAIVKLREDGQGLEYQLIGTSLHTDAYPFPVLDKMVVFPPDLISTPVGQKSAAWIRSLTPDILGQVPEAIGFKG